MLQTCFRLLVVVIIALALVQVAAGSRQALNDDTSLRLDILPSRATFLPGEPLEIKFIVTNPSSASMQTRKLNIKRGDIQLLIAYEDQQYKQYRGNWGLLDTNAEYITLNPGQQISTTAIISYNHAIPLSDVISTYYAFYNEGNYSVKAVFNCGVDKTEFIESPAIRINIRKPVNADADVWNLIKDNQDVAYFLLMGGKPVAANNSPDQVKSEHVVKLLKQAIALHPDSEYSKYIESALAGHEAALKQWDKARLNTVERTLVQAGQLLDMGKPEYAEKMLQGADNIFQETGISGYEYVFRYKKMG